MPYTLKGGLVWIDEVETGPAVLGKGKRALGGWLDQVRLANLIKRTRMVDKLY